MKAPPVCVCRRCRSAVEPGDLRCPVCYLAIPADSNPTGPSVRVRLLRCVNCGAAMHYRVRVQAPQCAFCAGLLRLEEQTDPPEQTGRYLPFTVDRAKAAESYRQWISRQGFFRPMNLASTARLESLKALWWVGWMVDADALVTWTADTEAGAGQAQWAPHSGELQEQFRGLVIPATRGLSLAECLGLIPSYAFGLFRDPPGEADDNLMIERFDMPRSAARAQITGVIQRLAEARVQNRRLSRARMRNFHSAILLRGLVTQRIAFPAYVLAYRHNGKLHRTVISGQDPTCVIGEAPRSYARLALLVGLALLLLGTALMAVFK